MAKLLRTVLVVGDCEAQIHGYEAQLHQDTAFAYRIVWEQNSSQILRRCLAESIDGILLDSGLSHTRSLELLKELVHHLGERCPPVVIIDDDNTDFAVQMLKAGAADYLVRERLTADDLCQSLQAAIQKVDRRRELPNNTGTSLQQEQTKLQQLAEVVPQMVWTADADGAIDYWNPRWYEYTGLSVEASLGYDFLGVVHPQDRDRTLGQWQQGLAAGKPFNIECRLRCHDGGYSCFFNQAIPQHSSDHGLTGWIGSMTNIDQLKQETALVRHHEQQLRRALDSLFSFVGVMTPDGILIDANRTALEAASLTPADVLDKPFEEAYWWSYAETIQAQLRDAIHRAAAGEIVRYDVAVRLGADQFITIDFAIVPLRDASGQVEYLIPSGIDVTERKRVEASLQTSQLQLQRQLAELETIYQSAPIGLSVLDRDLRFVRINQLLADINGVSVEDHIGRTVREVVPDLADAAEQILQPILETGEPLMNVEIHGETPAQPGVKRTWLEHFLPLKQGDQVLGISTVCEEITQRKHHEAERQQREAALRTALQKLNFHVENTPLAVIEWDQSLRISRWSKAAERIFGWLADEVLGKRFDEFPIIFDADMAQVADTINQFAGGLTTQVILQNRNYKKSGQVVYCEWYNSALLDETGNLQSGLSLVLDITDRVQAQQELQESERLLRLALAGAKAGSWDWEIATGKVIWSSEISDLYGFDLNTTTFQYADWYNAIHPDDRERANQDVMNVVEGRFPEFRSEFRIIHPQRGIRWLVGLGRLTKNAKGEPIRLSGINLDITGQKMAEQSLAESEQRLRLGVQVAGFAIARVDYVANQLELTPEAAALFGLPIDELVVPRERIHATFHPEDRAELMAMIQEALDPAGPGLFTHDHRILLGNGELRWLTVRKQVFFDRGSAVPHPTHAILVVVDITAHKQAEAALSQSEERYRTLFETMEDGFCVLEMLFDDQGKPVDYRFLEANPAFKEHTGLHQAVGKTARQLVPDLEEHWFQIYGNVAVTGEPVKFEQGSAAMNRWFEVNAFHLGPPDSRRVALLFKDISDRKTFELQQERLLQQEQAAREAAERANRMKDEFLAILSHELRTPLNPILGWAKLLQSQQFSPAKVQQALTTIERNAKLQTQLIDDLLDVARILRGQLQLDSKPMDLVFAIQSAIDTVKTAAEAKAITIHAELPFIGQIRGDSGRIQQIVWNLLSNAIKFTPEGGQVEVQLARVQGEEMEGAREQEDEGARKQESELQSEAVPGARYQVSGNQNQLSPSTQAPEPDTRHPIPITQDPSTRPLTDSSIRAYAQITISDTGQGINPKFLPHIFESFRQEDISISRQHGGLGLGLAIVRYLVEAHGGTIFAESPGEGLGALFTVQLPLITIDPAEGQSQDASSDDINLYGTLILTVDDDPDSCELLKVLLSQYGAEVITVTSAEEALKELKNSPPDLLISDIGMPEVNGFELIQQVRELPAEQGGQVPAIALTAYARDPDQKRALACGYQQHLAKPLDIDQLLGSIVDLLAH
jgi:PAS domain S-box-containing protein